jgi:hypothetical protein
MEEPTTTEQAPEQIPESYKESDVFAWANNLVPLLEDLKIELFLVNKNYVVYRTSMSPDLQKQLQPLFIDNILDFVLEGANMGLNVRNFEDGEAEDKVLQRTRLSNVETAKATLNWLKTQEHEIETFVEEEHDFKRIKGAIARCSHPELKQPFYVVKHLSATMMTKGKQAWLMRGGKFVPFDADGSLRIPTDNHLLVLDQDIYVFSQAKLAQLFGYDVKKYRVALDKVKLITENFKFNFADQQSWESLMQGKKTIVNKLQKIDPTGINQDELMKHAEELDIDLMTDDNGAIIIMDDQDLTKFVNLLNEDYMESPLTGRRYEITGKKPLKIKQEMFGQSVE